MTCPTGSDHSPDADRSGHDETGLGGVGAGALVVAVYVFDSTIVGIIGDDAWYGCGRTMPEATGSSADATRPLLPAAGFPLLLAPLWYIASTSGHIAC